MKICTLRGYHEISRDKAITKVTMLGNSADLIAIPCMTIQCGSCDQTLVIAIPKRPSQVIKRWLCAEGYYSFMQIFPVLRERTTILLSRAESFGLSGATAAEVLAVALPEALDEFGDVFRDERRLREDCRKDPLRAFLFDDDSDPDWFREFSQAMREMEPLVARAQQEGPAR